MSIDSVVPIAWDVLKRVAVLIKDQLLYVTSPRSYAQDLDREVRILAYEASRVMDAMNEAENNLRIIYASVTEWMVSTEEALKVARDLLECFECSSKACCYGTLPDPNFRYQFSRKAKCHIKVLKQLAQMFSQFKESDICFISPAPGIVAAANPARRGGKDVVRSNTVTASVFSASTSFKLRDDGIFESRALIMHQIMDALAGDDHIAVGVYGMGGVGKSTLLGDVERIIRENMLFDWVAKADVWINPDIKRIQGEIAEALGLTDIKDRETVSERAELLHSRLENEERAKRKVLIILDDLWERLDLKSVGIPCDCDNKVIGCKLLMSSRNCDVLRRKMGCDINFCLGGLQEAEANILFERTVGDKVHEDNFRPWVDVALRKCAGLPFLIIAMAKRLKHADLSEWMYTLETTEESHELIDNIVGWSYDYLEDEVKSVLGICAVYGVSELSFENLLRYSVGLGLLQGVMSMGEARNRLSSLIRTLRASSLLLESEDADGFRIHNLVREFIISMASRDHHLLVLKDATNLSKDELKSCTGICFPHIDMNELSNELDCPRLRILLLFSNNKSLEIPNSYFNSTRELMVLNLHGAQLTHMPSSFQFLVKLHTLYLDGCLLEDVAILGKLKELQILSFMNSKIRRLPQEIGELEKLRLLELNNCSQLQIIEPGVLGRLINLEELYMENSFDQWNAVELRTSPTNATLIELNNMQNLSTLHVSIPDPSVLPEDLNTAKLNKYIIRIGEVQSQSSCKGSRTLKLKLNPMSDIFQKKYIQTTLERTEDLFLDSLNGKQESIGDLSSIGFPKLKHLEVHNSPSIHYILGQPFDTAFKMLESLLLTNLINLEKICPGHMSSKSFKQLKVVRIESCDTMKVLFPRSLMREYPQLEEIGVIDCYLMQEIVEFDDYGKVELCNLRVLELRDLPNIENFITAGTLPSSSKVDHNVGTQVAFFNGQQVSMPSLESLTMAGIPNMKDIWSHESSFGMGNLRYLEVAGCEPLLKVINLQSLLRLDMLHTLTVTHCISVYEIFDLDGLSTSINVATPFKLTTICLEELPSLRRIWSESPRQMLPFSYLKELKVSGCNNLEFLFFPSMLGSLVQLRELTIRDCKKMESIIVEEEWLRMEISEVSVFPMLTCLRFECLESLTCFSRGNCSREARSLDGVKSRSTAFFNSQVVLPSLETLDIIRLANIEMIWDNQVAQGSFHRLKSICVHESNKLRNIAPSCILGQFWSLESLVAKECNSLEVVFELQLLNPLYGHPVAHSPLKELELYGLPELNCVWDKEVHRLVKFQCLCSVKVSHCKNLASLFPVSIAKDLMQLEELKINGCGIVELIEKEGIEELSVKVEAIQGSSHERKVILPFSRCFQHLKTLDVSDCDGLSNMFTQTTAGYLVELTKLRISNCKMLTEVISDEGSKGRHRVAFNQLKFMELDGLMGLRCFSSGRFSLTFHLLEDIIVRGCPNMEFFSRGLVEAPKLKQVRVSAAGWFWKTDLNITIQHIYEENRIRCLE